MRKIFVFNMITLDGYFEGLNHEIDWHNVDEEFNEFAINQLNEIGILLFGRITYKMMAEYWPTKSAIESDPIVAAKMNDIPKIVFSKTLSNADWNNTRLINNNIKDEVLNLRQQEGNDLAIFGSSNLTASLLDMDLIDEVRIMVNPLILGKGRTLFNGVSKKINLNLIKTKAFNSGNVLLTYEVKL